MGEKLIALFRDAYPDINFLTHEEVKTERYYATYSIGLFFDDKDFVFQPSDFRHVGLHRTAGYILGVDPTEVAPRIFDRRRHQADRRALCLHRGSEHDAEQILEQPDRMARDRQLPEGSRLPRHLHRPEADPWHGLIWNHIPNGAEDQTGDKPLAERVRLLKHAEFFVGLSSGLSWLAWAAGTPVVMISGFTHPTNEFDTPYRVINYHACNSCWNDPRVRFDHKDFLWCPRHKARRDNSSAPG